jgi:hypothetical protein
MRAALADAFRKTAVPLFCYYAVTLGLPIVNGADLARMAFVEHALAVLVVPPALIALMCTTYETSRRCIRLARLRLGPTSMWLHLASDSISCPRSARARRLERPVEKT